MSEKVILAGHGEAALLIEHGIIVSMASEPVVAPRSPVVKETGGGSSNEISFWGEDNNFPQVIIELAEKSTELPALLDWKARALQGLEVLPYELFLNPETGKVEEKLIWDEEILDFLDQETFKRYMREASNDFFWFWNVFPELIKNADGSKIAYLGTQDASWCRWGKMNKKGIIESCFIASSWPDAKVADAIKLKVVDPYQPLLVDAVKADSGLKQFIYPISYPSPGKAYYQLAPWDGIRTSKWLDVAFKIPEFKQALMQNQISLKYKIEIPVTYWYSLYPDWDSQKPEFKAEIKKQKLTEINNTLTGQKNAGKSILTEVGTTRGGEEIKSWNIVPIDERMKDGMYLEDSQEASAHLMRSLGLDPTLVGNGPGKNMGGGSGSDKRVAFNIYVALQRPYRDVILEPLNFIARYNGWKTKYPRLRFKFTEISIDTLDNTHQTAKEGNN
jgi:hypothetical protein